MARARALGAPCGASLSRTSTQSALSTAARDAALRGEAAMSSARAWAMSSARAAAQSSRLPEVSALSAVSPPPGTLAAACGMVGVGVRVGVKVEW
eukprot:scaffold54484_cov46-Phaeocystis_antarctica.AAC.1